MTIQKLQLDKTASGHDAEAQMLERLGLADLKKKEGRTEEVIDTVSMYKKAGRGSTLYGIAGGSLGAVGGAELAGAFTDSATIKLLSAIAGGAGGAWAGAKAGDAIERDGGFKVTDEDDGAARHAATAMGITGGSLGWALSKYLMGNKGTGSHALAAALGAAAGGGLGYLSTKKKEDEDTGKDPITEKQKEIKHSYYNNAQIANQDGSVIFVSRDGKAYIPAQANRRPIIFNEDATAKLQEGRNAIGNDSFTTFKQEEKDGKIYEHTYDKDGKLISTDHIYTIEKYDPNVHKGNLEFGYSRHPIYTKYKAKFKDAKDADILAILNRAENLKSDNSSKPMSPVYTGGRTRMRVNLPVEYELLSDEDKKYVDKLRDIGYDDKELHMSRMWPRYAPGGVGGLDWWNETLHKSITDSSFLDDIRDAAAVSSIPYVGLIVRDSARKKNSRKGFYPDSIIKIFDGLAGSTEKGVRHKLNNIDTSDIKGALAKIELEQRYGKGKEWDYAGRKYWYDKNVNDSAENIVERTTSKYTHKGRLVPDSVAAKFTGLSEDDIVKLRRRGYSLTPDNIAQIKAFATNNPGTIVDINNALSFKGPNGKGYVLRGLAENLMKNPGSIDTFNAAKQYLNTEFDLSSKDATEARKLLNAISEGKYKAPVDATGKLDISAMKIDLLKRVYGSRFSSLDKTSGNYNQLRNLLFADYTRRASKIDNPFTTGADVTYKPKAGLPSVKYKVGPELKKSTGGYELLDAKTGKSTGMTISASGDVIVNGQGKIVGINVNGNFVNGTKGLDQALANLPVGKPLRVGSIEVRKATDGTLEYRERPGNVWDKTKNGLNIQQKGVGVDKPRSKVIAKVNEGWQTFKTKGGRPLTVATGIGQLLVPLIVTYGAGKAYSELDPNSIFNVQ